jgi:hypothetical protein
MVWRDLCSSHNNKPGLVLGLDGGTAARFVDSSQDSFRRITHRRLVRVNIY